MLGSEQNPEGLPDGSGYPAEALRQAQCDSRAAPLWRSSSGQPELKMIVVPAMRAPNISFHVYRRIGTGYLRRG